MALIDPLADLKAEIAAEEAAAGGQPAPTAAEPAPDGDEPVTEAEIAAQEAATQAEEAAAAVEPAGEGEPEAKPAKPARMVPAERLNEYAVRTRKTEKELEDAKAELARLKTPPKPPQPQQPKSEEQIRAEAYAQATLDYQIRDFLNAGYKEFGQKQFDAGCNKIAAMIQGDSHLVGLAMEATDGALPAARAIAALYAMDPPEIEAFLRLSPIRQSARLERLAATAAEAPATVESLAPRPRGGPRPRPAAVEDEVPAPIRPISPNNRTPEGLGDDVPEDVWYERFGKTIMAPRH